VYTKNVSYSKLLQYVLRQRHTDMLRILVQQLYPRENSLHVTGPFERSLRGMFKELAAFSGKWSRGTLLHENVRHYIVLLPTEILVSEVLCSLVVTRQRVPGSPLIPFKQSSVSILEGQ
jgi:hypothetical protein